MTALTKVQTLCVLKSDELWSKKLLSLALKQNGARLYMGITVCRGQSIEGGTGGGSIGPLVVSETDTDRTLRPPETDSGLDEAVAALNAVHGAVSSGTGVTALPDDTRANCIGVACSTSFSAGRCSGASIRPLTVERGRPWSESSACGDSSLVSATSDSPVESSIVSSLS